MLPQLINCARDNQPTRLRSRAFESFMAALWGPFRRQDSLQLIANSHIGASRLMFQCSLPDNSGDTKTILVCPCCRWGAFGDKLA